MDEEPGCEFCGRVVLAGPPCCDKAYQKARADRQAMINSPEYQARQKEERATFKQAKAARQAAKRQRRLDRMNTVPWDEQDQARVEASEWEGMVVANDNH